MSKAPATVPILLCPYRFSADLPAMIAFLRTLGLARRAHTENNGFGVLAGRSGAVGVHRSSGSSTGARSGETQLSGEMADADGCELEIHAVDPAD